MGELADYMETLDAGLETAQVNGETCRCPSNSLIIVKAIDRLLETSPLGAEEERAYPAHLLELLARHVDRSLNGALDDAVSVIDALGRMERRFGLETKERETYLRVLANLASCLKGDKAGFERFCSDLVPGHSGEAPLLFNIACVGACHGLADASLEALARASDSYYPLDRIETDGDLEPLRDRPRYVGIVAQRRFCDKRETGLQDVLSILATLHACGFLTRKGSGAISHAATQIVREKSLDPSGIETLIEAWLEDATALPFLREEHHRFALSAFEALAGAPALAGRTGLAADLLTRLVDTERLEASESLRAAEATAALGQIDTAFALFGRAMSGDVSISWLNEHRPALSVLYRDDRRFRDLADGLEAGKKAMREYLLRDPDPADFAAVYEAARIEFSHFLSYRRKDRITALARFGNGPERETVASFLDSGFDVLRARRLKRGELVDDAMYDSLVRAVAEFRDPGFIPRLVEEFRFVTDDLAEEDDGIPRNYELKLTAGTIAIALSALGYDGSTAFMEPFLESYEWRYRGEDFVMQTRYGKWMVERDSGGALDWLADPENVEGTVWAVTALADLGETRALPLLRESLPTLANPVAVEVYKEAIARLEGGDAGIRPWSERMVRLFGVTTRTERVCGADSDDIFVARAVAATKDPSLAVLIEADDATQDGR